MRIPDDFGQRLLPTHGVLEDPGSLMHAAVLCGLQGRESDENDDPYLLLTQRAAGLRTHPGQFAFPGGKPETLDRDLLDTALREAQEEVGLPREGVRVLGRLASVPTPSGFMIVPFVVTLDPSWEPVATLGEVARVLRPRLSELTAPGMHRIRGERIWAGHNQRLHEFRITDPPVWGATARIVWDLLRRLGVGSADRPAVS